MSINPSVWEISGDRFKVQFRKSARRSEKSHRLSSQSFSCRSLKTMSYLHP
jgi:hypothetical protein